MTYKYKNKLFIIAVAASVLVACSKKDDVEHDNAKSHEGHEHENDKESDLDRTVEDLFFDTCEHNIKTHECDECRYEVGVVKASEDLFKKNILKTIRAQKRNIDTPLRLTGEIQFDDRRIFHVSTQAVGVIRKVNVKQGDVVIRGQELLEIESIDVGNAKAAYQEALAIAKLAQKEHARMQALRNEGISSEKEILRTKQGLDAAKIRVTAARGTLKRLGMNGSKTRGVSLLGSSGKLILKAPADGTILNMHAVSGELVKSSDAVVTIGDNSSLWVWADLYEHDYAAFSKAQATAKLSAKISVKAFGLKTFTGTVDFISPFMSETSRTIKVRLELPNPKGKLLAGMFANVDVFLPGDRQALSLPARAVLTDAGREFVFVHHKDDYYIRRPVVLGQKTGDQVEITEGLKGGELVVANGAFLLKSDVLRSKMGAGCAD